MVIVVHPPNFQQFSLLFCNLYQKAQILSSQLKHFKQAPEIPEGGSLTICSKKKVSLLGKC